MKYSRPRHTPAGDSRRMALYFLPLFISVACNSNEDFGDEPFGGRSAMGGTPLSSGGVGGALQSATGGNPIGGANGGAVGGSSADGAVGNIGGAGGSEGLGNGGNALTVGGTGGRAIGGGDGIGGAPLENDKVVLSSSTFAFQHYPLEVDEGGVWDGPMSPASEPTTTVFDTVIIENGYLKLTLLPDYGGRILSMVHKPTGRELLYQNPMGTPYLMNEQIFYYDYLVILGGIFPSFPDPEHGRHWNQPYELEVLSESKESITIRMSRLDDLELVAGVPAEYGVGRTDVRVDIDVTLRAGSTCLELNTSLTNTKDEVSPAFEFWMVNTLAPGSPPGDTAIPLETRILADMDEVHLFESAWPWFGDAEDRVSGEVFVWDNLSYFDNWVEQGTAFASPQYDANWWGLVNYESDMGIVRVSENVATPGLKLWTFGKESLNVDLTDSDAWLRPTIEMWYGITPEFWQRTTLTAGEVLTWHDSYFPTLGLPQITSASEFGAMFLAAVDQGTGLELTATATLNIPEQVVQAIMRLNGSIILDQELLVSSSDPMHLSTTIQSEDTSPGMTLEMQFLQDDSVLLSEVLLIP